MGLDLFNKQVLDTYDAIIKVGDNNTLTGTPKLLSDGRGNDTPIYLGTSSMGINITPDSGIAFQVNGGSKFTNITVTGQVTDGLVINGETLTTTLQFTGGTGDQGTMSWNTEDETIDLIVSPDVTYQLGQELGQVVRNLSGSTLVNGSVVKVTGASGNKVTVDLASYEGENDSSSTFAIVTETINSNSTGRVTTNGLVRGLNTLSLTEGVAIWLGANGTFTQTKPQTPNHLVHLGWVVRSHATEGAILVHISNGWEMEELHDVLITSIADKDLVVWDAANGYWKNSKTLGDISTGNITTSGTVDGVDISAFKSNYDNHNHDNRYYTETEIDNTLGNYQLTSEKGQALGYAPLDSGAKIDESYLPDSIVGQVEYQGTWNAATNTPTLSTSTTPKGHYYIVSVGGTFDSITYAVGDWIISDGTAWAKVDNTDAVTDFNGRLGGIVPLEADYSSFFYTKTLLDGGQLDNRYYTETEVNTLLTNSGNWDTAYGWGDWSTGVNKAFVDALNVDADTLDSLSSGDFLRANATDTATGNLTFSGVNTFNGSAAFNDDITLNHSATGQSVNGITITDTDNSYTGVLSVKSGNKLSWNGNALLTTLTANYVAIGGDTMTGNLTISNTAPLLYLKDSNSTGATDSYGQVKWYDSTNAELAAVGFYGADSKFYIDAKGSNIYIPDALQMGGTILGTTADFSGSVTTGSPLTIKATNPYIQWKNASGTRLAYIQHATNLVLSTDTGDFIADANTIIQKGWGNGTYGAEQLSIVGSYPSMAFRNSSSDHKWLLHHDSNNEFRFYQGNDWDSNSWTRRFALTASGEFDITKTSGTMIKTGASTDAFGYNPSYGHYIAGNGNTFIYGNGSIHDGTINRTILHSGNYTSYTDDKYLRSDTSDTMNGALTIVGGGDTLTLQKSNNIPALAFSGAASTKSVIEGGEEFNFYTSGSKRLRITSSGYIDQMNTSAAFRLYDGSTFIGGIGNGNWAYGATWNGYYSIYANSSKLLFNAGGSSTPTMVLDGNKLGVNITSPLAHFHVAGSSSVRNTIVNNVIIDGGTSVPNPYDGFGFGITFSGRDYGNATRNYAYISSVMEDQSSSAGGGDAGFKAGLRFYTNRGGSSTANPTEAMRIDSSGRVVIGSDSAVAKLHVVDNAFPQFRVNDDTDGGEAGMRLRSYDGSTGLHADIYVQKTGNETGRLGFRVPYNSGDRLAIYDSGLVEVNGANVASKSFRVYYDMDVYNTINFTSSSYTKYGYIANYSNDGIQIAGSTGNVWEFRGSIGYLYTPSWINIGNGDGIFSDTNGAHLYPNQTSLYGQWRIDGTRGGYKGFYINAVSAPHLMFDGTGNGGIYHQSTIGDWSLYHHIGNNCVGIGGSNTAAGYKARVNGALLVDGATVSDGTITVNTTFAGNYGSASFSWAGDTRYPTLYGSAADRWVMIAYPHVPYLQSGVNGHTGSTSGAAINFASNSLTATYWGIGVNPNNTGTDDQFTVSRGTSKLVWIDNGGGVNTNNWYYIASSGGLYFSNYSYGIHASGAGGSTYGNITTYGGGQNNWKGYSIHSCNHSFMGASTDSGWYDADNGRWITYYLEANYGMGLMTSTTSSSYKVYVGGSLYATGDIVAYSDRRVKENIVTIDSALDKVKALRGVYYNRIDDADKTKEIGYIAQEVHEAVPELASYAEDVDEWGVKYSQVTALNTEAIKELAAEKDKEIAELKAQIEELKQLILNK